MISISSLIYRSRRFADSTWDSLHEFTPHLNDGRARFFFVANDASAEVLRHLEDKGYPHVVHMNESKGLEGFAKPEYIRRVYKGYNRAIIESDEDLVLVNSDIMFSPGWLEGLIAHSTPENVVCSKLVERNHPRYGRFPSALPGEFGDHPDRFDKKGFLDFCKLHRLDKLEPGGAYGPVMMHRSIAIKAGLYPEGNPPGTYGDVEFFRRLKQIGVQHFTACSSIVYHFKEGEMSE